MEGHEREPRAQGAIGADGRLHLAPPGDHAHDLTFGQVEPEDVLRAQVQRLVAALGGREPARLHAGVVGVQVSPGGEADGVVLAERIDRRVMLNRHERCAIAGHGIGPQAGVQERLAGVRLVVARPLESVLGREARVAHAGVRRREGAELVPDSLGPRLAPVVAQPSRDLEDDPDVVAGIAGRVEGLADALDAALGVGDRAVGLGPGGRRRQHDVGHLSRGREEDVLHDHELEAGQQALHAMHVRLGLDRVLADAVERGQVAPLHRVVHRGQVPAAPGRDGDVPGLVEWRPELIVLHVLEARQAVRQGAAVAAALDVVLAAQRIEAAAPLAHVPAQERQVDQRQDVVHRVVVLGDAQRPADHRLLGRRVGVSCLADGRRGDAGLALGVLEGVALDARPVALVAGGRATDELLVGQAGGDDLAAHGIGHDDVRAHVQAQPEIRPFGGRRPARVHGEQARAVPHPLQEVMEDDRMGLPGVAAPEENDIRLLELTV